MKKNLLVLLLSACQLCQAQTFVGVETSWTEDFYVATYNPCMQYNTGILTYGENINNDAHLNNMKLEFSSPATVVTDGCPSWFGLVVQDQNSHCAFMKDLGGVDLSGAGNGRLSLTVKSDVPGAVLAVYLGYTIAGATFPSSSTWNTGSGTIKAEFTLLDSYATYVVDFEALNVTGWNSWDDKNIVNVFGLAPQTADATYSISKVEIGSYIPVRNSFNSNRTSTVTVSNTCGTAANVALGVNVSKDQSLSITTEAGGHIQIDPSFMADKTLVTDMFGRTEEFTGNDFYTQLRGLLIVNCISGDKIKNVKVVMN